MPQQTSYREEEMFKVTSTTTTSSYSHNNLTHYIVIVLMSSFRQSLNVSLLPMTTAYAYGHCYVHVYSIPDLFKTVSYRLEEICF